jgi:tRNA nucleotidyltransferase/poly(A) polymerase
MHFYDIEKGEIVDLVGGINDIKMVLLERLV